jgi:hypothetical protein
MAADPEVLTGTALDRPAWLGGWLEWLDAALHREILRLRARYQLSLDELRGLYVSDEQVDGLLAASGQEAGAAPTPATDPHGGAPHDLHALDAYCRRRVHQLHEEASPLRPVAQEFGLTDAEVRALVICLAPEVDLRYQALFGYLNDDITRRLPTVDLCHRLGDGGTALLAQDSPVFAAGLIEPVRQPGTIWRGTGLLLRDPARTHLLGLDLADPVPNRHRTVLVEGDDGAGTAASVAATEGRELLTVTDELRPGREPALTDLLVRARLHGAVLHAATPAGATAGAVRALPAAPVTLVLGDDWRPHLGGVDHEVLRPDEVTPERRIRAVHALRTLARQVPLGYGWDDLVLPAATQARLHELAGAIARREQVFDGWGFRRLSGGHSALRVMFTGGSGTGKTMSAAVLAREAGLDLFQVELSAVVSKYIGETEKNLEQIFRAAEGSAAILFFDEADALFGKRSEVGDAHDRYANIEASYLLQRLESYDGVLILATNLAAHLDQAFSRRLHCEVDFPQPDEAARQALWVRALPPGAPVADGVDHAFLARQFPLTGGEIRNVALSAAFLAAYEGRPIGMGHLIRALARQRHRQGKLPAFAEFGAYLRLVKAAD